MMQICPQLTNVKEQVAASTGKETQSAWSRLLPPKTVRCVLKRELQLSNNSDSTNNSLSTLTTNSTLPLDTDHISTGVQSRPPSALMSQSMTKEPAQDSKLPQILLGSTVRTNKKIFFNFFPEHRPLKQFQ